MVEFEFHTPGTAPEQSRERLETAVKNLGFIPGLWAVQAEAPALLEGYQTIARIFDKTSFDATEQQVVLMTANFEHNCTFCMAAHSWFAEKFGVPTEVIDALRDATPMPTPKLEALRRFTRVMIRDRGFVDDKEIEAFMAAGFGRQQILEVILGVGVKLLSNYTNHFAKTPDNEEFAHLAWSRPEAH